MDNGLNQKMQVFLSYAREDQQRAERLYQFLKTKGVDTWMDIYNLKGGEKWDRSISKQIKSSVIFIACMSAKSTKKTGNVQKELRRALEHQQSKPDNQIYIIPVLFEECEVPVELAEYHYIDLSKSSGYMVVYEAIQEGFTLNSKFGDGNVTVNALNFPVHDTYIAVPESNSQKKDFVYCSILRRGVFYRGPNPKEQAYCKEGDSFKKGDALFIIESMKVMIKFLAPEDGIVGAFLAQNGETIREGDPLFLFYYAKNRK